MRDDIKDLFKDLLKHLESKKLLLDSLLNNEKSASDLIKNRDDAEDEILKIIEYESALIDEINIADYNISQIKDEIICRSGIDFNKIFNDRHLPSNIEILNFKNEILRHEEILNDVIILKKQNNLIMDKNQKDLETQISELERISKIRIIIPKDLQSS